MHVCFVPIEDVSVSGETVHDTSRGVYDRQNWNEDVGEEDSRQMTNQCSLLQLGSKAQVFLNWVASCDSQKALPMASALTVSANCSAVRFLANSRLILTNLI